jgi:N-acetylneuraminate lyase
MKKTITGLVAAPFTPMRPDGSINLELIPAIVDKLIKNKVNGMFVCGSTGEGPSLTSAERKLVAEAFVKAAAKKNSGASACRA